MKTVTKFMTVLPVAAAVLALGGCGGSGNNDSDVPSSGGSITACYTANNTVSFAVTSSVPSGQVGVSRSTTGPMTYNGQAVTGQTLFYTNGSTTLTNNNYWTSTNDGVTSIATVTYDGTVEPDGTFFPQNMSPGQTATNSSNDVTTFVGFETLTLAGKTFSNTCHFNSDQIDAWFAPGYGEIKSISSSATWQYNGDL